MKLAQLQSPSKYEKLHQSWAMQQQMESKQLKEAELNSALCITQISLLPFCLNWSFVNLSCEIQRILNLSATSLLLLYILYLERVSSYRDHSNSSETPRVAPIPGNTTRSFVNEVCWRASSSNKFSPLRNTFISELPA